jgi:hypothetical protein
MLGERRNWLLLLALLGACGESAPKQEAAKPPVAPESKQATPAPASDFSGEVSGIVKLPAGLALPMAAPLDASAGKLTVPAGCPPVSDEDRRSVSENASTHGLFPVHIAVTQMQAAPPRAPVTHEVSIENCRLTPRLIGAMRGDKLRITNKSQATFLPVLPGDAFMQGSLPGASREVALEQMGPQLLRCGFAGYCGETVLITVAHSLYAVTDAEGRFTLSGIPLDQELVVHAWHPLFEVSSLPFKLSKAEPKQQLEFTLKPTAPAATPAP